VNVLRFDSDQSWAAGVATFWRDRLRLNPALRQCLASGNTPIPVYREIVRAQKLGQVTFLQSVVFSLDEFGGLRSEDPGSCRNMLKRDLIDPIDLPAKSFHFLDPDAADVALECSRYDQLIGGGFDLVLLGIGLNGHLGMNEPGSSRYSLTHRTDLHQSTIHSSARYLTHGDLPTWGCTVGLKQLFDAKEVWLIATGTAKADIVHRIVAGKVSEEVPGSLMREHPNCSLFMDASAGSRLA
jgi:glucosamine-6-phosphate isomerase